MDYWPDNLADLLMNGQAQDIYIAIRGSADNCIQNIEQAESLEEIDITKGERIRSTIEEEMIEISGLRTSLQTVDNKLKREKESRAALQRYINEQKKQGKDNNLRLLQETLVLADTTKFPNEIGVSIRGLRREIFHSLRIRVQITWCWDEILGSYRELMVLRSVSIGNQLTNIALSLQDDEAIGQVRELLLSLDLKISDDRQRDFSLPDSPDALWKQLAEGINTLEKFHSRITRLDKQRRELQTVQEDLRKKASSTDTKSSLPSRKTRESQGAITTGSINSKRMVFQSDKKD